MKWLLSLGGLLAGVLLAFFLFIYLPSREVPSLIPRCLFCAGLPSKLEHRMHAGDPGAVLQEKPPRSYVSLLERKAVSDRFPSIFDGRASDVPWLRPSQKIRESSIAGLQAAYVQEYEIDSWGRRKTAGARDLLLMGCSYVFGSGVEDSQTLPARLGAFNLGNAGDSPPSIFLRSQDPRYFAGIPSASTAIYYLIPDHVPRALGSYHLSRSWGWSLPRFELQGGKPVHVGMQGKLGLPDAVFSAWQYLEYLGITWPLFYTDRDMELVAALLAGIQENYLRAFPKGKFLVVIAPKLQAQPITYDLRAQLEAKGITYLDYGDREIHDYVAAPFIPADGHPSASYYSKVSEWIAKDLLAN